jgi:phage terminase small subunit
MSDDTPKLNMKQQAFVEEYLKDFNATQAAIRAGYSAKTAGSIGGQLLKKLEISRAIKEGVAERAMGADEVLLRIADIARGSLDDCLDEHGNISMVKARENGKLHLVRRYSSSEKFGEEVELYDKLKALELLGKNNGALGELKDALLKNLDLDKLTLNQLQGLANGDDIITVLLNP